MHFYSQTYEAMLALPLKTFWLLNTNIDRIQAQKDARSLNVARISQTAGDAPGHFRQQLVIEAGTIVKLASESPLAAKRDETGFAELKRMASLM